jgi:hypothetical protein
MVQTNMGLRPINYEIIDAVPVEQKIRKQVPVPTGNGEFEERVFIRIPVHGTDKYRMGNSTLEKWCYDNYKQPRYLGPWFKVPGFIILDEMTYTHWKLCE